MTRAILLWYTIRGAVPVREWTSGWLAGVGNPPHSGIPNWLITSRSSSMDGLKEKYLKERDRDGIENTYNTSVPFGNNPCESQRNHISAERAP
jgi:hypothetical protein